MLQNAQTPSPAAREQALRWLVRLQSGEVTAKDRRYFESWVFDQSTHREEFERFSTIWNILDQTEPFMSAEINQAERFWDAHRTTRLPLNRLCLLRWGALPVVISAFVALNALTPWWWEGLFTTEVEYQTVKGEQQSFILEDGSEIMMNTDTKLSIQLSGTERVVAFEQGEALFTVTHDEKRPFEVRAGNGIVHDLGTQFLIHKSQEKVNVFVLEGVVEVGLNDHQKITPIPKPKIVEQGQQVWYTADGRISSVESFDRQTASAWTEGKLIFEAKPLLEVLKEVGRYRSEEIRLLDQSLASIPVSGIFNINDLGSFMQALQDTLPVRATPINSRLVIVERALNLDHPISNKAANRQI